MPHRSQALPHLIRRRLKKTLQRSSDKDHSCRVQALLHPAVRYNISAAAALLFQPAYHPWVNDTER